MAKKKRTRDIRGTNETRAKPLSVRIAARNINDKYSEYPSSGLNPRRLARIFKEADNGDVRAQMELYEEMEEKDTHLFSQLQTRKLAVTGLDWEVQPASEDERDKEIAAFVHDKLNDLENLDNVFIDALDAIGKGISILELSWGIDRDGCNVITDIEYVHPKKLIWDSMTDEMKICTQEYPAGISIPENKFVIHKYKAKSGHSSRAGVLRIVSWMYLFKNFDLKDWVSFCEVFGMPLRLGKYDLSASDEDKRQLMEAIISLGTDAAGMVPKSTEIDFIESDKTSSADIYEKLARYCDEQISKTILGQTLTSDSGGGSYAQSKTHNEVRHDLTVADAKALAVTIRRDIIRPLVYFNFGADADIPLFVFDCEETGDQKEKSEIYKTLVCDMGLKIPVSHIYKTFAIPKPEDGEEILSPPIAAAPPSSQQETQESLKQMKLKSSQEPGEEEQRQLDKIVEQSVEKSGEIYAHMIDPLLKEIDKTPDLETLKLALTDKKKVQEIFTEMESPELSDLLQQSIYLSTLIGRGMDNG